MKRLVTASIVGVFSLVIAVVVAGKEGDTGSRVPAEQQLKQAESYVTRMREMLSAGFSELENARKQQNITRVNCVNEALTTMKGLLKLGEQNLLALQEYVASKDAEKAEHEYVKISITFNKMEEINGQLQGCGGPAAGVEGAVDGKPYIEKILDPDLPAVDPAQGLKDLVPMLEKIGSSSPFI